MGIQHSPQSSQEQAGARANRSDGSAILFLPTYSADFNPIEATWSKVKHLVRKYAPTTSPGDLPRLAPCISCRRLRLVSMLRLHHWTTSVIRTLVVPAEAHEETSVFAAGTEIDTGLRHARNSEAGELDQRGNGGADTEPPSRREYHVWIRIRKRGLFALSRSAVQKPTAEHVDGGVRYPCALFE